MLSMIALGAFGQAVVQPGLDVAADSAVTAANGQTISRLGIGAALALLACGIALAVILNFLMRPVSQKLARLASALLLIGVTAEVIAALHTLGALSPLGHGVDVVALSLGRDHNMKTVPGGALGFNIAMGFVGSSELVLAYLLIRSEYLPRTLGVLMLVGGLGYVINSSVAVLQPDLIGRLFPFTMVPGFFAEVSLGLWLLANGVDIQAWTRVRAQGRLRSTPLNSS